MNAFGYYGIFLGLRYQHGVAITKQLDADHYDASQTVTIQVPLPVPYMYDDADFKRVEGTFQHNGEFYRLVKQKYSNDVLTIVCVPDARAKRINQTMSEYAIAFGDEDDGNAQTVTVSFIKDYMSESLSILTLASGWHRVVFADRSTASLISAFKAPLTQPPDHDALT